MNSGHKIKYRATPQDKFYTPPELAKSLVPLVPIRKTDSQADSLLDPFKGMGAFYDAFPDGHEKAYTEIDEGTDFFNLIPDRPFQFHWLISNPPYSNLDDVLEHSCRVARVGFAYLLLGHAITPKRLERVEELGFGLTKIHLCKVFKWYGISAFCVFEKGKKSIIEYDRKVWR